MKRFKTICGNVILALGIMLLVTKILDWYNPYMDFSGRTFYLKIIFAALLIFYILLRINESSHPKLKQESHKKSKKKMMAYMGMDLALASGMLLCIYLVNYRIPQQGIKAVTLQEQLNMTEQDTNTPIPQTGKGVQTVHTKAPEDWHIKFADKFTDQIVKTDVSYSSPNLSIQLSHHSYDSSQIDHSENGKHEKYGSMVSYVVADIYIGDITCFQTAFAQDTYGIGYEEKLQSMSDRIGAVLAVNGDSYSNNRHKNNGTIIRNGIIYRARQTDMETCVLNWDGSMDIYKPGEISEQQLVQNGAYQSWIFGPSLLDENGKAKNTFLTWDYIRESHPRTAIGYYEPGHYCLLLVDGRQKGFSRGMFLSEMAKVFEDLGCTSAYNLDGGHCSFMMFDGKTANTPYKPNHCVQDGIFITEGLG